MGTNIQYLNTSIRRQYSKTGQTRFSKYPKTSIRILVQILVSGGCQTGPKSFQFLFMPDLESLNILPTDLDLGELLP